MMMQSNMISNVKPICCRGAAGLMLKTNRRQMQSKITLKTEVEE